MKHSMYNIIKKINNCIISNNTFLFISMNKSLKCIWIILRHLKTNLSIKYTFSNTKKVSNLIMNVLKSVTFQCTFQEDQYIISSQNTIKSKRSYQRFLRLLWLWDPWGQGAARRWPHVWRWRCELFRCSSSANPSSRYTLPAAQNQRCEVVCPLEWSSY